MLGVIISGFNQEGIFNESVYHKFLGRTIFEHTLDNALKAEQVQKVIVCLPASQRKNVKGGGIFQPLIRGDRSLLGRKALFHFQTDEEDVISGLYHAALTYGLDHIVLIHANCPVLPAWLTNSMILKYMSETNHNSFMFNMTDGKDSYDLAFQIQIFPFWMLANEFLYAEDRKVLKCNSDIYTKEFYPNHGEVFLPKSKLDLHFTDLKQRDEFDFLLNELTKGADLGELIEDLNESEKT